MDEHKPEHVEFLRKWQVWFDLNNQPKKCRHGLFVVGCGPCLEHERKVKVVQNEIPPRPTDLPLPIPQSLRDAAAQPAAV